MGVSSLLSILCAAMSSTDVGDAHSTCMQATYVTQRRDESACSLSTYARHDCQRKHQSPPSLDPQSA